MKQSEGRTVATRDAFAQGECVSDPEVPERLGPFEVESVLGTGAMGYVYRGRHALLDAPVALKVLRPEYAAHPGVRSRFLREGRTLARLRHPNLVQVRDLVEPTATSPGYLVMELLEGETLAQRLDRVGPLSVPEALDFAEQIAAALSEVHGAGVVHRDLKPSNLIVVQDEAGRDVVKLLDFGVAKGLDGTTLGGTRPGVLVGTPSYMAPEQVLGTGVDQRIDIYQFGLVLYEMLAGIHPCREQRLPDVLLWHTTEHAVDLPNHVPAEVKALIADCIAIDADRRPQHVNVIARRLAEAPRVAFATDLPAVRDALVGLEALDEDEDERAQGVQVEAATIVPVARPAFAAIEAPPVPTITTDAWFDMTEVPTARFDVRVPPALAAVEADPSAEARPPRAYARPPRVTEPAEAPSGPKSIPQWATKNPF